MLQLYKEFAATYKHWFEFLLPRSNQKLVTGHHPSNRSFKIVAECPVIGQSMTAVCEAYADACLPACPPKLQQCRPLVQICLGLCHSCVCIMQSYNVSH